MKVFTKYLLTLLLLGIASVVNASEYEIDQKFTSLDALEGQLFAIVNETDGMAIYNKDAQNLGYSSYSDAVSGTAYLWKIHSLADEADVNVQNAFTIEAVTADGSSIGLWGNPAIYLNSGAVGGFDGCFLLGNKDQYGCDVLYGGAWEIEYDADKGFALKNVARGGYFAGVNPAPTGEDPIYWTFCTLKEIQSSDPLAAEKEALAAAIAKGQMYNGLAYTEESFGTLEFAIDAAEYLLANPESADAQALTDAASNIYNVATALQLKEGFSNLTPEYFMTWDSPMKPADCSSFAGCAYELFTPSGAPFGDANVGYLNFVNLLGYNKLYITYTEGTPRLLMNRDIDGGLWNEIEEDSHLIEYPKSDDAWSAKYFANGNGILAVDLKQIIADKGFATLNAIKGANWQNVTVTGLYLYEEAAAPGEDVLPIDIQFGEYYNNEAVSSYAKEWTATKDGKTWTLVNFNNNNNVWSSVKCGRKGQESIASIASPAINAVVTNYVVSVVSAANVNAVTLTLMNGEETVAVYDITDTFVAGDVNVAVDGQKGYSYVLTIDNASASKNGSVEISKVALYGAGQYAGPAHIANTAETAYTVGEAFALIEAGEALTDVVFVKGVVSQVTGYNATYKSITYYISENGTTDENQLQCYSGKGIEGADFENDGEIEVGAKVIVTGNLKNYNGVYEFDSGNVLVSYEAPIEPAIADGTYYIKNVASGNFFTGANSWGTQASVAPSGAPFEVAMLPEGGYSLKYILSTANKYVGSNLYVDSTTPDGGFAIENNGDGTYVIKLDGFYLAEGDEIGSTNDHIVVQTEALSAAAKWQFLTVDEAIAAMKNAAPANATFLISNPNYNRNTSTEAWIVSADCTNRNLGGGDTGNFCAESYHSTFTISQVLANAPAGRYMMTAQGFYRQDDYLNEDAPVFFANDKSVAIPVKTGSENSMTDASNSFKAGAYTIEPFEFTVFEDGQLTIGVKGTSTSQWVIWDNFQLTYLSSEVPAEEFEPAYQNALAAAIEALQNEDYSVVDGIEKENLENTINKYNNVEGSQAAYEEAIKALVAATNAYVAAAPAYLAFGEAQVQLAACKFRYPYAKEGLLAYAEKYALITVENAEMAQIMAVELTNICRQVAESSAMLEGVGGSANMTGYIYNPNAESYTDGWDVVLGDNSGGSINVLSNEPPTYSDGSTYQYFDGGNWGSDYWDVALQQGVELPAGKYLLTVSARASEDVMLSLFAGEESEEIFCEGATGGLYGNGWNDASLEFELSEPIYINIGVRGETSVIHNWMSFTRFRLAKFGTPGEEDPELVAPEGWTNLITNGNLASDDVSSFISKVYPNVEDMFGATIAEGAGVNGSRGIVVSTPEAEEAETWDSQFWINLNRALPEGTILHVEFDYAASDYSWASTQAHGEPSMYQHWVCLGNVEFAQEWQHFSTDIEVSEEMAKGDNGDGIGLKSIAFNLNDDKKAVDYYFDNFGVWAQLPPYDTSVAIFDFNASDHPTSSSESNEGDIVEDEVLEVEGVTMTITPSEGKTPNRYWNTSYGPQLRMYGGTMTIEAPVGKAIKFVEFNSGKWNQGNIINGFESYEPYWEGNSTNVVLDVAGNTQFNSILVTVESSNSNTTTYQEIVWTDIVINGNIEDNNMECFYVTEQSVGGPFIVKPTKGVGVNGSRGILVHSSDDAENDWDTQFFVRLPYQLPAGTPYRFSFDFKADKFAEFRTESHAEPSEYIWWEAFCNSIFDTEWQTYKCEGVITNDMSTYDNMMQTIAFDLALNREATKFVFDNIKFEIPTYVEENLELNPAVDPEYYPVIAPAIVESYPGNKTFNVWNGIMEFNVTFDKPVNCESIVATLNDEPLTVIPNEGVEETIFLARTSDTDLADGNYTIFLKNVYPAEDDVEGLSGEYSITFTVGPIDLNPEVNVEDILADELWDATPENGIPTGYILNYNGETRTSETTYGSGPRMFVFAEGGDFTHGLYFREGYTQYGSETDFLLEAGKEYTINFKSAMWKENGQKMNFQILNNNEDVVFEQTIENNPNLNGDRSPVEGATNTTIKFVPDEDGNYLLRWVSDGFSEVLLANPTVKHYSGTVYEEVVAFFEALENAKVVRDANVESCSQNEVFEYLNDQIEWAEAEYQYFSSFNEFLEAANNLDLAANNMRTFHKMYDEYYLLANSLIALHNDNATTKFVNSWIYEELKWLMDRYVYNGRVQSQFYYNDLYNAYSELKYYVNLAKDMFTEGPSEASMTGYAVLTERIRQGAETMRTLGIENEDLLWAAEYVLDDEDWLVDEIKQSIKNELYSQLKNADNTLFDPIIDEETGEEITPEYNMSVYVENPNIYKWGTSSDYSVPGWYHEGCNVTSGWTEYNSWDVPVDAMFSNWGGYFWTAQVIDNLPAGTYTVKFAVGERDDNTYSESYAYVYTDNEYFAEPVDYIGQTFPTISRNNGVVTIENVVVTDGWMQIGVEAGDGSHLFFNEVQLLLTGPAPGYDYRYETEVLMGDVNLDGEVTTSDAVATVDIALNDWYPGDKAFRAADVNYTGNITVSDVVGIVNIILNDYEWYTPLSRGEAGVNYLTQDGTTIGLMNTNEFVAFQMDVTLADGAVLNNVMMNQRAQGLNVRFSRLEGNTYRIMGFSMNKTAITGSEGELLKLDITGNQNVTISNVEFTDTAANAYALGVNDATGINGIMAGDANADYYTVDGVKNNKMRKGMNVVKTADGKVRKMFVK